MQDPDHGTRAATVDRALRWLGMRVSVALSEIE